MSDVISELGFWPFWLRLPDEGPILPKFSLETRLESESFEPMIDFLAFLIHELWPKINKMIKYLISGFITNFVVFRS